MDDELQTFRTCHRIPAHPFIVWAQTPARAGPQEQGHSPIRFSADHLIERSPFGLASTQVVFLFQKKVEVVARGLFGDDLGAETLGRADSKAGGKVFPTRLKCAGHRSLFSQNLSSGEISNLRITSKEPWEQQRRVVIDVDEAWTHADRMDAGLVSFNHSSKHRAMAGAL